MMIRHAILTILRDWEKHGIAFDERSLWVMVWLEAQDPGLIHGINQYTKEEWRRL